MPFVPADREAEFQWLLERVRAGTLDTAPSLWRVPRAIQSIERADAPALRKPGQLCQEAVDPVGEPVRWGVVAGGGGGAEAGEGLDTGSGLSFFEPHRHIGHIEVHIKSYVFYVPMWFKKKKIM